MCPENSYNLLYAPLAYEDLDGILAYIASESQDADVAYSQILRIEEAMLTLKTFPLKAPLSRDTILARRGYRMLVVDNYAVFYLVNEQRQEISIRRILYNKRNFRWLL